MLYCPRTGCGAKKPGGSNYQRGDTCPNGHTISTADIKNATTASVQPLMDICPKCGHKNDEMFNPGDPCPNCHEIL